jgi:hypothetical protein
VWQLHHELKIGKRDRIGKADRALLGNAMDRHPDLAAALLPEGEIGIVSSNRDGWVDTPQVTIIRTPKSDKTLHVELNVQTPPQNIPYTIKLRGDGWKKRLKIEERGHFKIDLPPPLGTAELLTLELEGKGLRADPSSLAVQVTFGPVVAGSRNADDDDDDDQGEGEGEGEGEQ